MRPHDTRKGCHYHGRCSSRFENRAVGDAGVVIRPSPERERGFLTSTRRSRSGLGQSAPSEPGA